MIIDFFLERRYKFLSQGLYICMTLVNFCKQIKDMQWFQGPLVQQNCAFKHVDEAVLGGKGNEIFC